MIQKKQAETTRQTAKTAGKVSVEAAEVRQLIKNIETMNTRLRKVTSLQYRFTSGVVQGFGVALGGTIVAYIVISILIETLARANYIPFINMLFDSEHFNVFVSRLTNLQTQLQ